MSGWFQITRFFTWGVSRAKRWPLRMSQTLARSRRQRVAWDVQQTRLRNSHSPGRHATRLGATRRKPARATSIPDQHASKCRLTDSNAGA